LVAEDSGVSQTSRQLAAYQGIPFQVIRVEDSGERLELLIQSDINVVFTNVNALQTRGVEVASADCSTNNRCFAFIDADVVEVYVYRRLTSPGRRLIIDDSPARSKWTCEGLTEVLPNSNISRLGKVETLPLLTNKRAVIAVAMAKHDHDRRRQTFECDTAALL